MKIGYKPQPRETDLLTRLNSDNKAVNEQEVVELNSNTGTSQSFENMSVLIRVKPMRRTTAMDRAQDIIWYIQQSDREIQKQLPIALKLLVAFVNNLIKSLQLV